MREGAGDSGTNRRTARADGQSCPDYRRALGGNLGPLDLRSDDCLRGRSQQLVVSREAQSPRVPHSGVHDRHALTRRWKTHHTVLLTH